MEQPDPEQLNHHKRPQHDRLGGRLHAHQIHDAKSGARGQISHSSRSVHPVVGRENVHFLVALAVGVLSPRALPVRLSLYSRRQASISCFASVSVVNQCAFRHSDGSVSLNDST
jgi:hypothetical protein